MTVKYWVNHKLVSFDNVQVVHCGGCDGIYGVRKYNSGQKIGAWLYADGFQMENEHSKEPAIMDDNCKFHFGQIMPWSMLNAI